MSPNRDRSPAPAPNSQRKHHWFDPIVDLFAPHERPQPPAEVPPARQAAPTAPSGATARPSADRPPTDRAPQPKSPLAPANASGPAVPRAPATNIQKPQAAQIVSGQPPKDAVKKADTPRET